MSEVPNDDLVARVVSDYRTLRPYQQRAVDRCIQALELGASFETAKRAFWQDINRQERRRDAVRDRVSAFGGGTAEIIDFPG